MSDRAKGRAYLHTAFFAKHTRLMQEWANFVDKPIEQASADNVVSITAAGAAEQLFRLPRATTS